VSEKSKKLRRRKIPAGAPLVFQGVKCIFTGLKIPEGEPAHAVQPGDYNGAVP